MTTIKQTLLLTAALGFPPLEDFAGIKALPPLSQVSKGAITMNQRKRRKARRRAHASGDRRAFAR